jgi:O-antigen ligase
MKLLCSGYFASTVALIAGYVLYFLVSDPARLRFEGVLFQHNAYAMILVVGLAIGLILLGQRTWRGWSKWLYLSTLFLHVVGLLLTLSRGALLALFAALAGAGFIAWWQKKSIRVEWKRMGRGALFLLCAFIAAYGVYMARVYTPGGTGASSTRAELYPGETVEMNALTSRLEYMRVALRVVEAHPLFGVGAGAYWDAERQYRDSVVYSTNDPHNLYLRYFAELGVLGGLLFLILTLGLFGFYVVSLYRSRRSLEQSETILFVLVCAFVLHFAIDVHGMFPLSSIVFLVLLQEMLARDTKAECSVVSSRVLLTVYFALLCIGFLLMQSFVYSEAAKTARTPEIAYSFSQTARRLFPLNTEALMNIGLRGLEDPQVYQEGGNALMILVSSLRPQYSSGFELLSRYADVSGRDELSLAHLRQSVRYTPVLGLDFRLSLVRKLILTGNYDEALKVIREGIVYFPDEVFQNDWWGDPKKEFYRVQVLELRRLEGELSAMRAREMKK